MILVIKLEISMRQLHWSLMMRQKNEIKQLKLVYNRVKDIPINDIDVLTIDGKIYEKPHVKRIIHLIEKMEGK